MNVTFIHGFCNGTNISDFCSGMLPLLAVFNMSLQGKAVSLGNIGETPALNNSGELEVLSLSPLLSSFEKKHFSLPNSVKICLFKPLFNLSTAKSSVS